MKNSSAKISDHTYFFSNKREAKCTRTLGGISPSTESAFTAETTAPPPRFNECSFQSPDIVFEPRKVSVERALGDSGFSPAKI